MEIKIGIRNIGREVSVDTDQSAADVEQALRDALQNDSVLVLADTRGRKVLVPAAGVGYLEIGEENARRVGFGSV